MTENMRGTGTLLLARTLTSKCCLAPPKPPPNLYHLWHKSSCSSLYPGLLTLFVRPRILLEWKMVQSQTSYLKMKNLQKRQYKTKREMIQTGSGEEKWREIKIKRKLHAEGKHEFLSCYFLPHQRSPIMWPCPTSCNMHLSHREGRGGWQRISF